MDCLDSRSAPLRVPVLVAQHGLDALLGHPRFTWSVVTLVPSDVRNTTRDKQVSTAHQGNGVHCRRALRHRCLSGSPSTQMSGAGSGVLDTVMTHLSSDRPGGSSRISGVHVLFTILACREQQSHCGAPSAIAAISFESHTVLLAKVLALFMLLVLVLATLVVLAFPSARTVIFTFTLATSSFPLRVIAWDVHCCCTTLSSPLPAHCQKRFDDDTHCSVLRQGLGVHQQVCPDFWW